jgi:hypothetical protein
MHANLILGAVEPRPSGTEELEPSVFDVTNNKA